MVFNNPIQATNSISTSQNSNLLNQLETKAPLLNPIFNGTLTSPTINAITALQVNGVNINTLYAPMAPMLDEYALESEVSSAYASISSVNNKAPLQSTIY